VRVLAKIAAWNKINMADLRVKHLVIKRGDRLMSLAEAMEIDLNEALANTTAAAAVKEASGG
jgi:hypothetical protein